MAREHAKLAPPARNGEIIFAFAELHSLGSDDLQVKLSFNHGALLSPSRLLEGARLRLDLFDVAHQVEGLFGQIVQRAGQDLLESRDGLPQRDVLAGETRELHGHEEA